MANSSMILDKWREYFRGANCDIFSIIEQAIMVAASDCPYDFKLNRDRIAEMLFTCKVTKCFGCDKIELAVPNVNGSENSGDKKRKSGIEAGGSKDSKESKVNSCVDDDHREILEMNVNQVSNYSYGEAEALTDEIEEDSQLYEEVMRVKEILDNSQEKSEVLLFDSLRRLQLLPLSVEILKATEVGKSVNALRKHRSTEIRNLVRTLVGAWTVMVDAWVSSTEAIAGAEVATESVKTSVVEEDEEGLPSPPLDEGAFFATPSMELSQFFDGMDDDGNPRNSGEFNKNRENGRRRPRLDKPPEIPMLKRPNPDDSITPSKDRNDEKTRNQQPMLIKQANRPHNTESGLLGRTKLDKGAIQKKPAQPQQEKLNNNEDSVQMKLEAAKRKLHERYQEAENAKKQRTIQVMEIHELPKQNPAQRSQNTRIGIHNRQHWANGRR